MTPSPLPTVTERSRRVVLEDGLLSVDLEQERLGPVLAEISRRSGISIFTVPDLDDRLVTLTLARTPLDAALRELLADFDVFFYSSAGSLRTVWAYEQGGARELVPVPPESWASTEEFERKLLSPSAAERMLAIETIVSRNGPSALDTVIRTLADGDADVRLRALDVGLSAGVVLPDETLNALTSDASPAVRALALETIVNGAAPGSPREAEAEQLIRRMLGDASPDVRARAQEILEGFEAR